MVLEKPRNVDLQLGTTATDPNRAAGDRSPHAASDSAQAQAHEPPQPDRYGRYELLGELGFGGMGVVYEAYDPELDRKVALKVIGHSQKKLGALGRQRLVREARAMAKLAHPNVIAIHDVGSVGDEAFVAMELVHGGTLKQWLREQSPTHDELLDVFMQAGRGLMAAHAAGLVHRDFKPSNVMVGHDGRVRVLDFGLARTVVDSSETPSEHTANASSAPLNALTHAGAVVGTPAYMAPEQFQGGVVDERTDQFSYCVALYQALYDMPPFSAESIDDRAAQVASGNVQSPPDKQHVSAGLREAVLRGLRPDPNDRHPSMAALLRALDSPIGVSRSRKSRLAAALLIGSVAVVAVVLAVSALRGTANSAASAADSAVGAAGIESGSNNALRMQMVDSDSALMAKLATHVHNDAEATRLGVRGGTATWLPTGQANSVTEHYLFAPSRRDLMAYLSHVARTQPGLALEPGHEILLEQEGQTWRTHYLWTRVELDSASIVDATVHGSNTGGPEVLIRFNKQGAARLAATTGQNVGRKLTTIVRGIVTAAPIIAGPILGGTISLTVDGPNQEAKQRAATKLARELGAH